MLMSVSFKKTTLTLTHDAAPNVKGLKLSLNKVKPQLISLLDHAPKNYVSLPHSSVETSVFFVESLETEKRKNTKQEPLWRRESPFCDQRTT